MKLSHSTSLFNQMHPKKLCAYSDFAREVKPEKLLSSSVNPLLGKNLFVRASLRFCLETAP